MSKRNREKRYKKSKMPIPEVTVTEPTNDEIDQIFFGKGSEELTDELINELVSNGVPRDDLIYLQSEGYRYNRSRNSFVEANPSFEGF